MGAPIIRSSTDIRRDYNAIEALAKETGQPIYLTKNGRASLVVIDPASFDYDAYVGLMIDEAVEHIRQFSSGHTDAIVTEDQGAARRFVAEVDSAAVLVNASTRFTDGGEFGFGAEIGISTQKLHARGPMGLPEMTSTKYIVTGDGHVR